MRHYVKHNPVIGGIFVICFVNFGAVSAFLMMVGKFCL